MRLNKPTWQHPAHCGKEAVDLGSQELSPVYWCSVCGAVCYTHFASELEARVLGDWSEPSRAHTGSPDPDFLRDPELRAMHAAALALLPLDAQSRGRALRWMIGFLASNGGIEEGNANVESK
jgi:hypothetical protein